MTEIEIAAEANRVCAYSDLAMAIAAAPLTFIMFRTRSDKHCQKTCWALLFLMFTLSSLLGFFAHEIYKDGMANRIIWMILAPVMYETVSMFVLTSLSIFCGEGHPDKKQTVWVHVVSAIGYVPFAILKYIDVGFEPIRVLAAFNLAYGTVAFVLIAIRACKPHRIAERLIFTAFIPLCIACVFQIKRGFLVHFIWYINEDTIAHVCIIIAIMIIFLAARRILKRHD